MPEKRVVVYVDGFNLYHAIDETGKNYLKWLDLWTLAGLLCRPREAVTRVKYFSAYATWLVPSYRRHQRYVQALEARGVEPILGRFKQKTVLCRNCRMRYIAHEEKETDVNIATHLMADALQDRFDRALVVSADTDLNEAVRLARTEAAGKEIDLVAPPGRKGRNSRALFEVTQGKLAKALLPQRLEYHGKTILRPTEYDPPER